MASTAWLVGRRRPLVLSALPPRYCGWAASAGGGYTMTFSVWHLWHTRVTRPCAVRFTRWSWITTQSSSNSPRTTLSTLQRHTRLSSGGGGAGLGRLRMMIRSGFTASSRPPLLEHRCASRGRERPHRFPRSAAPIWTTRVNPLIRDTPQCRFFVFAFKTVSPNTSSQVFGLVGRAVSEMPFHSDNADFEGERDRPRAFFWKREAIRSRCPLVSRSVALERRTERTPASVAVSSTPWSTGRIERHPVPGRRAVFMSRPLLATYGNRAACVGLERHLVAPVIADPPSQIESHAILETGVSRVSARAVPIEFHMYFLFAPCLHLTCYPLATPTRLASKHHGIGGEYGRGTPPLCPRRPLQVQSGLQRSSRTSNRQLPSPPYQSRDSRNGHFGRTICSFPK